jgi:hypothetical protein
VSAPIQWGTAVALAHISDIVLSSSADCLRLAAECSDDHIAIELQLLSMQLLLAAINDAELLENGLPIQIPA